MPRLIPLAVMNVGLGLALTSHAGAQEATEMAPLSAELRTAWEKAGAAVGWLWVDPDVQSVRFREDPGPGKVGELPGFKLRDWQNGVLASAPSNLNFRV